MKTPSTIPTGITREEKQFYEENGYLVRRALFPEDEVRELRAKMTRLLCEYPNRPRADLFTPVRKDSAPVDPGNPHFVWRIMELPILDDVWFRLALDPRIVQIVSDLLGPNINFHNGKSIIKPPAYPFEEHGWHQDFPYELHDVPDLMAAIIYLDDMDAESGATRVVPGSHKLGLIKHDINSIGHTLLQKEWDEKGFPVTVQAGDVIFFSVLLVHAAGGNKTNRSRCGIINEYKTLEANDLWGNRCNFAELPLTRNGRLVYHVEDWTDPRWK